MYYIAILIDQRKYHVLPLRTNEAAEASLPVPSFVVQRENSEEKIVFSVAEDAQLIARTGTALDESFEHIHVQPSLDDNGLTLQLTPAGEPQKSVIGGAVPGFRIVSESGHLQVRVKSGYPLRKLLVTVQHAIEEKIFTGQFLIHLVPQRQIYDVVMDFGSEASQIVINQRLSGTDRLERTNIVNHLLEYYYADLQGKNLHQTADEPDLYRSLFFVRKRDSIYQPTNEPGRHGAQELLNLLTDEQEIDTLSKTHTLISNLKLAHLGAFSERIYFHSRQTNELSAADLPLMDLIQSLQHTVINYLVQMVLEDLSRRWPEDRERYLVLKLLVPNVFDQAKVSGLVAEVHRSLETIARQHSTYVLAGWEVKTLSESDASFLGFKREKEIETRRTGNTYWVPGKDYLIIDVGKGTTDFSIVKYTKEHQLLSVYRSGFIGAGNYLSFAFVETIFAALFGYKSWVRQKAIFDISIRNADIVDKIAFTALIEECKRNFNFERATQLKSLNELIPQQLTDIRNEYETNPADPSLLGKLVTALKTVLFQQGSIKDENQLINRAVQTLVGKIVQEVRASECFRKGSIDRVILTGRSFKFTRLGVELKRQLGLEIDTTPDLKKICLLGAFSSDRINFDSNLVGLPIVYRYTVDEQNRKTREVDLGASRQKIKFPLMDRLQTFNTTVNNMFGGDPDDEFGDVRADQTPGLVSRNEAEKLFLTGLPFERFDPGQQTIAVGGMDYKDHTIQGNHDINVFYTGDEFIVRTARTSSRLSVLPSFAERTQFIFQTLYPFAHLDTWTQVNVQPLEDELDLTNDF